MRRISRNTVVTLAVTFCVAPGAFGQVGGGFDLTWNTIDGGGAMFSTGGGFELGGTIGQPDAGTTVMTGGGFELSGGFWFAKIACSAPTWDTDADGDVDLADFLTFQDCFNGPNRPWRAPASNPQICVCLDGNDDGDVDLGDFLEFQDCFNGPNRPPKCM